MSTPLKSNSWHKQSQQTDLKHHNLIWLRIDISKLTGTNQRLLTISTQVYTQLEPSWLNQWTRLVTPLTDKHYTIDSEDNFRSGCWNVSHQQVLFRTTLTQMTTLINSAVHKNWYQNNTWITKHTCTMSGLPDLNAASLSSCSLWMRQTIFVLV